MLNAILYVLETGCQWRAVPKDFPPKSSVHAYFIMFHCDGILTRIHHAHARSHAAFVILAMVRIIVWRLARA